MLDVISQNLYFLLRFFARDAARFFPFFFNLPGMPPPLCPESFLVCTLPAAPCVFPKSLFMTAIVMSLSDESLGATLVRFLRRPPRSAAH